MNLAVLAERIRDIDLSAPRDVSGDSDWADGYLAGSNMALDAVVDFIESVDTEFNNERTVHGYHQMARARWALFILEQPAPIQINHLV